MANDPRMVLVAEEDGFEVSAGSGLLTNEQENYIAAFTQRWCEILTDKPEKTNVLKHYINTRDHSPVRSAPYSIPASKLQGVQAEVNQLLKLGIIVPSHAHSPWSSHSEEGW